MTATAEFLPRSAAVPKAVRRPPAPLRVAPIDDGIVPTELDLRYPQPPPKPVPALLAALHAIPPGRPQYVRTRSDPAELLQALAARGVEAYPAELPDGTWRTLLICGPERSG